MIRFRVSLTDDEHEHPPQHGALVLGALRLVAAAADARHGHEDHRHGGEAEDGARDHQGAGRLDVGCTETGHRMLPPK